MVKDKNTKTQKEKNMRILASMGLVGLADILFNVPGWFIYIYIVGVTITTFIGYMRKQITQINDLKTDALIRDKDIVLEPLEEFELKPGRKYLIRRFKSYPEQDVIRYSIKKLNSFGTIYKETTITHVSEIT